MPFKNMPKEANDLWEKVYNSSKEAGDSEEKAAKKAWGTVKKSYKKVGDKWVKKESKINSDVFIDLDQIEAYSAVLENIRRIIFNVTKK